MPNKLGAFIRKHREQTQPQDVGLPIFGRRRTPGLRREELAQLCGVSPTWLTWLEQERPISASVKVLSRLAEVMHLTPSERGYLFQLADRLDPQAPATHTQIDATTIVDNVNCPAYMLDRHWNVVAWNSQASTLFTGWLDAAELRVAGAAPPNLLSFMFLHPHAKTLTSDWAERAQRLAAEFRADCGKTMEEMPLAGMITTLQKESKDFALFWDSQRVLGRDGGLRQFRHAEMGTLHFEQVTLQVASSRGDKLVMLLPQRITTTPAPTDG